MNTTFEVHFSRLEPPETAPRETLILGHFKYSREMVLVVWDPSAQWWDAAVLREHPDPFEEGKTKCFMGLEHFSAQALIGWLPIPRVIERSALG